MSGPLKPELNTSQSNHEKKKRIARACDVCRRKKIKCNGVKPYCSNCVLFHYDCTYLDKPKKRGPHTTQPRTLEARLKRLEGMLTTLVKDSSAADRALEELRSIQNGEADSNKDTLSSQEREQEQDEEEEEEEEEYFEDNDEIVEKEFKELHIDSNRKYNYLGSSSGFYFLEGGKYVRNGVFNMGADPNEIDVSQILLQLDESFPPQDLSEKLLEIYFTQCHPYFPVFHKEQFLNQLKSNDPVSPVLLNAIYGTACLHCGNPGPLPNPMLYSQIFYARAKGFLDKVYHTSNISVVQGLLLMIYDLKQSWINLGLAIRMAQDLGLHRDLIGQSVDIVEKENRKLTWWSCLILDRLYGAIYGKPITISEGDFDTKLPMDRQNHNSGVNSFYYAHFIKINIFIGRIIKDIYSIRTSYSDKVGVSLWGLNYQLRHWEDALSSDFKYDVKNPRNNKMHTTFLNLWYHYAVILLNRPFIPKPGQKPMNDNLPLRLCSRSASWISVIVDNIPEHYLLHGLLLRSSLLFCSSSIHLINALLDDKKTSYVAKINLGVNNQALAKMSKHFSSAQRYLNLAEDLIEAHKLISIYQLPKKPILLECDLPPSSEIFGKKSPRRNDEPLILFPSNDSQASSNSPNLSTGTLTESPQLIIEDTTRFIPSITTLDQNELSVADPVFYPSSNFTSNHFPTPMNLFTNTLYPTTSVMNMGSNLHYSNSGGSMAEGGTHVNRVEAVEASPVNFVNNPTFIADMPTDFNEWSQYIGQFSQNPNNALP